ncbi:MAG TPA: hypothetical protein VFW40_00515 [Capsulimonadaceae bacterium]|nr:hypothetical protein [Capsulimonadaceae bacterium]
MTKRVFLLLAALLFPATTLAATGSPHPQKAWKLLFVRTGNIWVANGDGTGQKLVIKDGDAPCWSPEKKMIAFAREGNVWVANADGSHERQLTSQWRDTGSAPYSGTDGNSIDISWEPKDNLITFAHWERVWVAREGSRVGHSIPVCSIYDVPLHPTAEHGTEALFDLTDGRAEFYASENEHPAWSKSGDKMAFVRNGDIWEADRAERLGDKSWAWTHKTLTSWGWEVTRIAAVAGYDAATFRGDRENVFATHLSWSPNGRYLAYGSHEINGGATQTSNSSIQRAANRPFCKFWPTIQPSHPTAK